MQAVAVGQRHQLALTDIATGGQAIGRLAGLVVFVDDGAPGDETEVEITEVKKSYARARIAKLLRPSPDRVTPPCPIYHECGGCHLQHMSYSAQLRAKKRMVEDALFQAKLTGIEVEECLRSPDVGYRNKMQLVAGFKPLLHGEKTAEGAAGGASKPATWGKQVRGSTGAGEGTTRGGLKSKLHAAIEDETAIESDRGLPFLGLYARNSHRVVRMDQCLISHPISNKILKAANTALRQMNWSIYDENEHRGFLRHVLTRVSTHRNEALVVLVATTDAVPNAHQFTSLMRAAVPEIAGVLVNVNTDRTNVVLGPRTRLLWGKDHIIEQVRGLQFKIGATSFFQVNSSGLVSVADTVSDMLGTQRHNTVVDAYCGVGALSLMLAGQARKVIGIEEVSEAIENARQNAELNDIKNADFMAGTVEKVLPQLYQRGERAAAAILDPPRKGCDEKVLETLAKMRVERIVYVSCNPATQARDLALLGTLGYRCKKIQPIDMFPHTTHVEAVASIVRER
jgi:23S rRNA (uracil1939-C5)-methyltransferase